MSRVRSTELFCFTNVRPDDYNTKEYNAGDCTTRAMTYCLSGKKTYKEIENEQYRLGSVFGTRRNASGTWDKIMKNEGYRWIYLKNGKIARSRVALMLKSVESPLITHSRGHVAVVHNGLVKDTWNSTSGLVDNVMVKSDDFDKVVAIFAIYGIECEEVDKAVVIVKHRRRRYNYRFF